MFENEYDRGKDLLLKETIKQRELNNNTNDYSENSPRLKQLQYEVERIKKKYKPNENSKLDTEDVQHIRSEIELLRRNFDDDKKLVLIFKDDINTNIDSLTFKLDVLTKECNSIKDGYMVLFKFYLLLFFL